VDWILLATSLALVTAGAEALVRGASFLALRMGVSPLFVGLTIVGFGTSSPELGASLAATLRGAPDVSVGNVVGSNVFNIAVILGITAVIRPVRIALGEIRRDLVVAIAAAAVPWSALATGGAIGRSAGAALLAVLAAYVVVAYRAGRRATAAERELARREVDSTLGTGARAGAGARTGLHVALVAGGLALLVWGSGVFVDSALRLGRANGVSELVLGLTVVAAGTSMPELLTSLVATLRGSSDLAVGNIVGSNIFNIFGILGACALAAPQTVDPWVFSVDAPVMMAATLSLVPILRRDGCITRAEGAALLAGYAAYLAALISRGEG
jgi:cation:H+ antiporter